jgi:hypothetical protein
MQTLERLRFFHLLRIPNYVESPFAGRERAFLAYFL